MESRLGRVSRWVWMWVGVGVGGCALDLYGKSMVDCAAVCRHPLQTITEFYRSTELIHVTYRICDGHE